MPFSEFMNLVEEITNNKLNLLMMNYLQIFCPMGRKVKYLRLSLLYVSRSFVWYV